MCGLADNVLKLYLVFAITVLFCLEGCRKKEPAGESGEKSDKTAESGTKRAQYANDLDRLGQLSGKINRACKGSYVVVLGAGDSDAGGGLISVDYALFDKLSDDGAAVLIAESITTRFKSFSPTPVQTNIGRAVLQADEAAGRYIARTGFSPAGFVEWIRAKRLSATSIQQSGESEKMRIAAFMRGYSSERNNSGGLGKVDLGRSE